MILSKIGMLQKKTFSDKKVDTLKKQLTNKQKKTCIQTSNFLFPTHNLKLNLIHLPPSQNFPWDSNLKDAASIANAATTSRSPTSSRQHRGRGQFGRRGFRRMRDGAAPHGVERWWSWCVVFVKGGSLTRIKKCRAPKNVIKVNNYVISVETSGFCWGGKMFKKNCWFFKEMKQMLLEKYWISMNHYYDAWRGN